MAAESYLARLLGDVKRRKEMERHPVYAKMTEQIEKEIDPEEKERLFEARRYYWQKREELKKLLAEKEEQAWKIRNEINRIRHLMTVNEQIARGIPVKHVVHCEYPGLEFREELDASEIGYSYKDDYDSYQAVLSDWVSDCIPNLMSGLGVEFEKFLDMDGYFKKDEVPASGHFWYGEIRTEIFGNGGLPLNENIRIYMDDIGKDGSVIETRRLEIGDCFNLESQKEFLMECGFFDATDEYISISLDRFIKESTWNVALRKGEMFVTDIRKWPAPRKDGSWIDRDGTELEPFIWFGDDGPDTYNALWNIHPEMAEYYLGFWFSEHPLRYIVEYDYSGHAGCYGGTGPDMAPIRESCPVLLEKDDTIDTVREKIRAFFLAYYEKAHRCRK